MSLFGVVLLTADPNGATNCDVPGLIKIDGREAVLRSIELFLNRDEVKQIQLVLLPEIAEQTKQRHGAHFSFSGVKVATGGPKWIDQIAAAVVNLKPEITHVIVHDAARVVVPYTDIEAIEQAATVPATALTSAIPARLIELDEGNNPMAFHHPRAFGQLLTPQIFTRQRFEQMAQSKHEAHASEFKLISGSALNVRLNGPGDTAIVKAMLNLVPKPKKGSLGAFEEAQW
ncbi:MAG: 2-C-methyl-D-erythritol 4-phosphate cytidylyltransferase [Phycisphaerales bacterium]|nr:2-C-methyl-D-erythritol 4-phosphate cytidylyltransferase [Phycisphaerales bacterium]